MTKVSLRLKMDVPNPEYTVVRFLTWGNACNISGCLRGHRSDWMIRLSGRTMFLLRENTRRVDWWAGR